MRYQIQLNWNNFCSIRIYNTWDTVLIGRNYIVRQICWVDLKILWNFWRTLRLLQLWKLPVASRLITLHPPLSLFFQQVVCKLLTATLDVALTAHTCPVALYKRIWYVARRLGKVVSGGISVPKVYVTNAVNCFNMADNVIDYIRVGAFCRVLRRLWVCCRSVHLISCRLSRWCVTLCVWCQLFDWRIAFQSQSLRRATNWDYIWHSVFVSCIRMGHRIGNLKWANSLQQEVRS